MRTRKMSLSDAQKIVADYDLVLTKVNNEYRLADRLSKMRELFPTETVAECRQRVELRAYYTNCLLDAVATARHYRHPLAL